MEKQEVQDRIIRVVCDILGVETDLVTPESDFVFDLGAESTQSVQLVVAFEEEFGIDMDDEAALQVQTIGGATDFIAEYVK